MPNGHSTKPRGNETNTRLQINLLCRPQCGTCSHCDSLCPQFRSPPAGPTTSNRGFRDRGYTGDAGTTGTLKAPQFQVMLPARVCSRRISRMESSSALTLPGKLASVNSYKSFACSKTPVLSSAQTQSHSVVVDQPCSYETTFVQGAFR